MPQHIPFPELTPTLSPKETAECVKREIVRAFPRTAFEIVLRETKPPVLTVRWWDGPNRTLVDTALEDFRSRKWEWQRDANGDLYSEEWREAHTVVETSGLLGYRMYFDMTFELDRHFTLLTLMQAAKRLSEQHGVAMPEIRDTVAELLAEYGSMPDTEHLRAALGKFYEIDDGGTVIGGVPLQTLILNDLEFLPFL
ncbi:MAG: hypothetical protein MUF71_19710 [Candidatus Kapabacteria bacterium]|jgi:hypothetical protein|nr:hypothetical protein [Candidatus Kapabacteria bacterium]